MATVEQVQERHVDRAGLAYEVRDGRERLARFDRVARMYRAIEYASFGPALEWCRFCWIPELTRRQRALVLGDGDGRFVSKLLEAAPQLRADAVDGSPAMLRLLRRRVAGAGNEERLTTVCADARGFVPPGSGYDQVATHFFLGCFTEAEAEALIARVRPHLSPGARWVVSEFEVARGGALQRWLSRGIVSGLYAAFRVLTGLRVRRIPPWRVLLENHGFVRVGSRAWLGGLLVAEVWELERATAPGMKAPNRSSLPVLP